MSRTCDAQCHKQLPFRMVVVHPGMVMLGMVFKKKKLFLLYHILRIVIIKRSGFHRHKAGILPNNQSHSRSERCRKDDSSCFGCRCSMWSSSLTFSTFSTFQLWTVRLIEIQSEIFALFDFSKLKNVTFSLFHFSTFRNSKCHLSTFRLFEIENDTFSLFDFSIFENQMKPSHFSTFRFLTFRNWFCILSDWNHAAHFSYPGKPLQSGLLFLFSCFTCFKRSGSRLRRIYLRAFILFLFLRHAPTKWEVPFETAIIWFGLVLCYFLCIVI